MTAVAISIERATYSVREVAARLGVGKDAIYELIRRREYPFNEGGPVRVLSFGARRVIPCADLDAFLGAPTSPGDD
jgi:excisionase family DNA binding protein